MVNGISTTKNTNLINSYISNNSYQTKPEESTKTSTVLPGKVPVDYNVTVPMNYTKLGVNKLINGQEIHCYKLANGQKVFIAPIKSPMTYVNTYVNTGSMNEKDSERGISHFNEHMAFNGTTGSDGYMKLGVGDVFRKVGEMGGTTNASTSWAETNYTIGIPQFDKKDLETSVAMQSSMTNNLEMSDKMVDKEHGPVCSEINMYSDYPDLKATNLAIKSLYNVNSTSEDLVAGRVDNIQNVDKKKVTDYYKNHYYPANMSTVITGDVNPDEAIGLIAKHFHSGNTKNPDTTSESLKPIDKTIRQDLINNKAVATNGSIAFNGPANKDFKEEMALKVAFYFLFGKANSVISNPLEKINTTVSPNYQKISTKPTDGQLVTIDFESNEEQSEKALKTIFTNLKNFNTPTDKELKSAVTSIKSREEDNYEDPERLNYTIGSSSLSYDTSNLAKADEVLNSLTGQDIKNAVDKYFNIDKASVAISHPQSATKESIQENYIKANSTTTTTGNTNVAFKGLHSEETTELKKQPPMDTSKVIDYKLNNNYGVALYDTPQNSNAKVQIQYKSLTPIQAKPGVTEVLTNMLNNGTITKNKDEMSQIFDDYNVKSSFSSSAGNGINITGNVPSQNISNYVDIVKDQITNPRLNETELDTAKKYVKDIYSNSQATAAEGYNKAVYGETPLGYTNEDIVKNVDNITMKDVSDLYQTIMKNSSATISVAAPLGDRKVMNAINSFAQMPTVKPNNTQILNIFNPNTKSNVIAKPFEHSQAEIIQGYKFKSTGNVKDETTFDLMTSILSNGDTTGLFNNLREKEKLAYAVRAVYDGSEDTGNVYCSILTTTDNKDIGEHPYDNLQKSINGFDRQINKMLKGDYTDKELEVAKKGLKQELLDKSYGQIGAVSILNEGQNNPYGKEYINQKLGLIDKITRADIDAAAKYAFSNKPIYSIVASQDTLNANKDFLAGLENK